MMVIKKKKLFKDKSNFIDLFEKTKISNSKVLKENSNSKVLKENKFLESTDSNLDNIIKYEKLDKNILLLLRSNNDLILPFINRNNYLYRKYKKQQNKNIKFYKKNKNIKKIRNFILIIFLFTICYFYFLDFIYNIIISQYFGIYSIMLRKLFNTKANIDIFKEDEYNSYILENIKIIPKHIKIKHKISDYNNPDKILSQLEELTTQYKKEHDAFLEDKKLTLLDLDKVNSQKTFLNLKNFIIDTFILFLKENIEVETFGFLSFFVFKENILLLVEEKNILEKILLNYNLTINISDNYYSNFFEKIKKFITLKLSKYIRDHIILSKSFDSYLKDDYAFNNVKPKDSLKFYNDLVFELKNIDSSNLQTKIFSNNNILYEILLNNSIILNK